VYERMQSDPRFAKVPVLVSTSDPTRAPTGALVMKKPIDLDRLLSAVRSHCQASSARRDPCPRRLNLQGAPPAAGAGT
jgi:hypothetical protein